MNPDILKVIVVSVALVYLNCKIKPRIDSANYRIMNWGLCLLLFAAILDFTDGFESLRYIPIIGKEGALQDILEDQFGDTPGLALLVFGAFREILKNARGQSRAGELKDM